MFAGNSLKLGLIAWLGLLANMAFAAPANDDFASATTISGLSGTVSGSNVGATLEAGEPSFINTDNYAAVDKSVWYAWTAPTNGVVSVDTFGSDFDSVLAVYTNAPDVGNLVAGNDDFISLIMVQSRVTFTAVAGTTYYISVNGNAYPQVGGNDGNVVLNWHQQAPFIPSGTFQFTRDSYITADGDQYITDTSVRWSILGARVTVTRVNGHSGRVHVPYTVIGDDTQSDADTDGELIFDDYQMSADIIVPVSDVLDTTFGTISVALGTPYLDAQESPDLMTPTVSETLGTTEVVVNSTIFQEPLDPQATNPPVYFNFERSTYRVKENEGSAVIRVIVPQAPPDQTTYTVDYTIDHHVTLVSQGAYNNAFDLQAGSDYATPDGDFTSVSGTLTWDAQDGSPKEIVIPIVDDGNPEFYEDLQVSLFNPRWKVGGKNVLQQLGMVENATVTILDDDQPAGAVDRNWNTEDSSASIPPFLTYPGTQGGVVDGANGNGGTVYASVTQPDGKTILGGSFTSYDSNPYRRLVRTLASGYPDPTFMVAPNSGANGTIRAIALQEDGKIVIAGDFTAFNGSSRYHIARLNANGALDATFNPGSGANDKVFAVKVQSNGQIVIGGEFTAYNGTEAKYIARLNADGSLDTSFAPPEKLNGPVYALALPVSQTFDVDRTASGGAPEDVYPINLGSANSGTLTVTYDFLFVPDQMKVFYGDTNTITGTGVLIWDSGLTNNPFGPVQVVIPFGPTNGLNTNLITIVMNQGNGDPDTAWDYTASVKTASGFSQICAGGAFDKAGDKIYGGVVRFNADGSLSSSFQPGLGTYNPVTRTTDTVYALALQADGGLLVGGSFSYLQMMNVNGLARLDVNGTLDTAFGTLGTNNGTFNPYTGVTDTVKAITLQPDGKVLVGGNFLSLNQTRRAGIARLFADGSVDTSFMDTAYNQFAGLNNHYYNPDAINLDDYPMGNQRNAVNAISVEVDSATNTLGVIIGGNFLVVGGGYFEHSGWKTTAGSGIVDNARMDVHPRSNVARLIGGATPGPGNLEFSYPNYSASKADGHLYVTLVRTNGNLGIIGATFGAALGEAGQAGVARIPQDFTLGNVNPTWPTHWDINVPGTLGWMYGDGWDGLNKFITSAGGTNDSGPGVDLTINNTMEITGDLNAGLVMAQPSFTNFYLGGELIPLGAAMGARQAAEMKIIDPNFVTGTFGFSAAAYTSSSNLATITINRINGTRGRAQVSYSTFNGTAVAPTDYTSTFGTHTFEDGDTTWSFNVPLVPRTSLNPDKTVNLRLFGISGGGKPGVTNAVLTIVNKVFGAGHVAFAFATNGVNEDAGSASIVLNRLGGTDQTLKVTAITANGTAVNGVNYVGSTNQFQWNSGDATPRVVTIPVIRDGLYTSNLTVNVRLTNGMVGTSPNAYVLGLSTITNSTLIITNVDFPGTVHFTTSQYSVKKYAGYALIPVVRTGGSAGTVTVNYSTVNGTAQAGVDFTAASGQLTFPNGVVSQYFQVPINAGSTSGLISLTLVLTNTAGTPNVATLNIIDTGSVDEPPGTEDVTFDSLAGCNGNVYALALQTNQQLLVVGDFTKANEVPRNRIARLNADGSLDNTFSSPAPTMGANDQVRALAVQTDGRIVVGGFFTNVNSLVMNRIARLNYDGSVDSLFNPGSGANSPVYGVAETFVAGQRKLVVGGAFTSLNGLNVNSVGRLNDDGTPDVTFNPGGLGANGIVYAVAVQTDGKILIGGDFTAVNNVNVSRLARLNVDGSVDLSFTNAAASDSVRAITLQLDGKILIGGYFTNVNGVVMNRIARLNVNGTLDSSFTPGAGADGPVLSIACQSDGRIMVGGSFSHCSGVTRSCITRLLPDGTVDPTINFGSGANNFVAAMVVQNSSIAGYPADVPDEKIIIGGGFTAYNNSPAPRLVRIYGGSQSGPGAFEFSSATYTVDENGTRALITVSRTGGTSGTNYVNFATSGDTAVAGVNYAEVNTNLLFVPGEVQQTVAVPVMVDGAITGDLLVDLSLEPAAPAEYGNQPIAVLSIVNTDSAISFSSTSYLATKYASGVPNGNAVIQVNRLGSTAGVSTVVFNTTTNGTAVPDTDYVAQTNVTVVFGPGVAVQTVPVPVINGQASGDRTVTLELSAASGSSLQSPTNALLTILDRTLARGEILFTATNYVVNEGAGTINIPVIRTNGSFGSVSVSFATVAGTAKPNINYVTTAGTITFGDGVTSRVISIPLVDNSVFDGTVDFSVNLSNPSGGATLGGVPTATVQILDNEVGVNFAAVTNFVSESTGAASVIVQRVGQTNSAASVNYTTVDGTALAGINYSNTFGVLNFSIGETLKSITIPLIANTNATGDLTFDVRLTAPSGAQLVAPSNTVVVIQDAQAGISFTTNYTRVLKNVGQALIPVVCANPALQPVLLNSNDVPLQVSYFTVDGTAKAGVDYQPANGTLVFTNGIITNTIAVTIYNNNYLTGDRNFSVVLTNATAPGRISPYGTNALTIAESNTGISFDRPGYSAYENGVFATINVIRVGYTDSVASVSFTTTNGTALAGVNYVATNGVIVLTNGVTSGSFRVPLIANPAVQPNLTAQLLLGNPTNALLVSPFVSTLSILETGGSFVIPAGAQVVTNYTSGKTDGIINSNETVQVLFAFRNASGLNVTNLIAYLKATNGVVAPSPASQVYGPLKVYGHSASRSFTFTARGTNAQAFYPTFDLYDNAKFLGTAAFNFTLGSWTNVYANTNYITINDNTNASPYPSVITVSGAGSSILSAVVTFTNLSHTSPGDIAALVVSPSQSNTLVMAHAGAQNKVTGITIKFDDAASNSLPSSVASPSTVITNGTYKPSGYLPLKNFP